MQATELDAVLGAADAWAGVEDFGVLTEESLDEMDELIIGLLRRRIAADSEQRQKRRAGGLPCVTMSAQYEMARRYRRALGAPGSAIATGILQAAASSAQ